MKKCRIFALLLASAVCLAFCGCDSNDGPVIVKNVSRMTHFMRVDVSNDLSNIADIVCEYDNIYGEKIEKPVLGSSTLLVENTWRPELGTGEPTMVRMTLKATPRGDSATTESTYLLDAVIMSELSIYDQNNTIMGYNGIEKSMSKTVPAGTNIKSFLETNFPVTYTFKIVKGNNSYSVVLE